jgi:hypothetical protein
MRTRKRRRTEVDGGTAVEKDGGGAERTWLGLMELSGGWFGAVRWGGVVR